MLTSDEYVKYISYMFISRARNDSGTVYVLINGIIRPTIYAGYAFPGYRVVSRYIGVGVSRVSRLGRVIGVGIHCDRYWCASYPVLLARKRVPHGVPFDARLVIGPLMFAYPGVLARGFDVELLRRGAACVADVAAVLGNLGAGRPVYWNAVDIVDERDAEEFFGAIAEEWQPIESLWGNGVYVARIERPRRCELRVEQYNAAPPVMSQLYRQGGGLVGGEEGQD